MSKSGRSSQEQCGPRDGKGVVGQAGLEPATPRLSSACSNQLSYCRVVVFLPQSQISNLKFQIAAAGGAGGGKEIRTPDILLAKQVLYQLSYVPGGAAGNVAEKPIVCTW